MVTIAQKQQATLVPLAPEKKEALAHLSTSEKVTAILLAFLSVVSGAATIASAKALGLFNPSSAKLPEPISSDTFVVAEPAEKEQSAEEPTAYEKFKRKVHASGRAILQIVRAHPLETIAALGLASFAVYGVVRYNQPVVVNPAQATKVEPTPPVSIAQEPKLPLQSPSEKSNTETRSVQPPALVTEQLPATTQSGKKPVEQQIAGEAHPTFLRKTSPIAITWKRWIPGLEASLRRIDASAHDGFLYRADTATRNGIWQLLGKMQESDLIAKIKEMGPQTTKDKVRVVAGVLTVLASVWLRRRNVMKAQEEAVAKARATEIAKARRRASAEVAASRIIAEQREMAEVRKPVRANMRKVARQIRELLSDAQQRQTTILSEDGVQINIGEALKLATNAGRIATDSDSVDLLVEKYMLDNGIQIPLPAEIPD